MATYITWPVDRYKGFYRRDSREHDQSNPCQIVISSRITAKFLRGSAALRRKSTWSMTRVTRQLTLRYVDFVGNHSSIHGWIST